MGPLSLSLCVARWLTLSYRLDGRSFGWYLFSVSVSVSVSRALRSLSRVLHVPPEHPHRRCRLRSDRKRSIRRPPVAGSPLTTRDRKSRLTRAGPAPAPSISRALSQKQNECIVWMFGILFVMNFSCCNRDMFLCFVVKHNAIFIQYFSCCKCCDYIAQNKQELCRTRSGFLQSMPDLCRICAGFFQKIAELWNLQNKRRF